MNKKFFLTPSIYCADLTQIYPEIKKLNAIGVNWIHFDVMDGHFVNNYALGPKLLDDIRTNFPNLIIDVHLMGNMLLDKIALFRNANYITFHFNSAKDIQEIKQLITIIKHYNIKVGIALDLENTIKQITNFLPLINLVTIMAIKPGFTGQEFESQVWKKIKLIKDYKQTYPHLMFQIDGGVRWTNIHQLIANDLDLIVVGSLLFSSKDYQNVIDKLQ